MEAGAGAIVAEGGDLEWPRDHASSFEAPQSQPQ